MEIGEEYEGKVKTIMPYGAFVEVLPGIDGLLHVSELDWKRVENVEDVFKEGNGQVQGGRSRPQDGKIKLSRKFFSRSLKDTWSVPHAETVATVHVVTVATAHVATAAHVQTPTTEWRKGLEGKLFKPFLR